MYLTSSAQILRMFLYTWRTDLKPSIRSASQLCLFSNSQLNFYLELWSPNCNIGHKHFASFCYVWDSLNVWWIQWGIYKFDFLSPKSRLLQFVLLHYGQNFKIRFCCSKASTLVTENQICRHLTESIRHSGSPERNKMMQNVSVQYCHLVTNVPNRNQKIWVFLLKIKKWLIVSLCYKWQKLGTFWILIYFSNRFFLEYKKISYFFWTKSNKSIHCDPLESLDGDTTWENFEYQHTQSTV